MKLVNQPDRFLPATPEMLLRRCQAAPSVVRCVLGQQRDGSCAALASAVVALLLLGLVMVFSASIASR